MNDIPVIWIESRIAERERSLRRAMPTVEVRPVNSWNEGGRSIMDAIEQIEREVARRVGLPRCVINPPGLYIPRPARQNREREAAWVTENRCREAMGLLPIPRAGQCLTTYSNSQRERERMGRLTEALNEYLSPEGTTGEFEPVTSPDIFIPRSASNHLNEASGRISEVSHMGDLSEVVESYERLRADSDRGRSVDSDDLDRLFAEIDNLTEGVNHAN
jgi:hypothetical protein